MAAGEKIAERVAAELRSLPDWSARVSHRPGDALVRIEGEGLEGAMLELRPPPELSEVPLWIDLGEGRADLSEVGFDPSAVAVVHWEEAHRERGLLAGFPQALLRPALAGRRHSNPIAGGRRADGTLELWIEATSAGAVVATIDADSRLGTIAELRWQTAHGQERLLVALLPTSPERRLGLARMAVDPTESLTELNVLLHDDLGAIAADADLLRRSDAAAASAPARRRWRELLQGTQAA